MGPRLLFQLSRVFKDEKAPPTARLDALFDLLFPDHGRADHGVGALAPEQVTDWDESALGQALGLAEQVIALYVTQFHDSRVIPVTCYKREKKVRRELDRLFSALIKEYARRTGGPGQPTLISEEPIYYLTQKFRDRKFPKPKSAFAALEILKARFHSDLVQCFGRDPFSDSPRRVLLPHEIR